MSCVLYSKSEAICFNGANCMASAAGNKSPQRGPPLKPRESPRRHGRKCLGPLAPLLSEASLDFISGGNNTDISMEDKTKKNYKEKRISTFLSKTLFIESGSQRFPSRFFSGRYNPPLPERLYNPPRRQPLSVWQILLSGLRLRRSPECRWHISRRL